MTASHIAGVPVAPEAGAGGPAAPTADAPERRGRRKKAFLLLLLLGILAALVGLSIWYLVFREPIPLPGIPEAKVPSYLTSMYGVDKPTGVAVSPSGDRIYVTENGGDYGIKILDAGGNVVGTMTFPESTGNDHVPIYAAIDPLTSEVYVSDRPTGSIHIFDRDGTWQRQYTPATALPGWQPLGMTFDKAGNLYVTELRGPGQRVLVFDRTGAVIREIGGNEGLNFPNGVAVDGAGKVWVTDSNNGRVFVFDSDGTVVSRVGRGNSRGNLGLPRGIAIDGDGHVFVVDSTGAGVAVYGSTLAEGSVTPDYLGFVGGVGVGNGEFEFPVGVAVDGRGRVYVADTANNRVQVWSY